MFGLVLRMSFFAAGCQSGTEPEINTGKTDSTAAAQPQQTVDDLKITAKAVP